VPDYTLHPATGKGKGTLAPFTADRSVPCGSLGSVVGDPQLPDGTRLTLAPPPPGLPPRPVPPTRGAWPVARLQAARSAPPASAGAASRSSSGPFEVEARTQRIPRGVLPGAALTERSARCRALGTGGLGLSPTALMSWGIRSAPESESSPSKISVLEHAPDSRSGSDVCSEVPSDAPSSRRSISFIAEPACMPSHTPR